jgi:hypothetical protein
MRASASASVSASGNASGPLRRMAAGTIASINAARDSWPDRPQHGPLVVWRGADVPRGECRKAVHTRHHASPIVAS